MGTIKTKPFILKNKRVETLSFGKDHSSRTKESCNTFLEAFKDGDSFSGKFAVLAGSVSDGILSPVPQEPVSEGPVPWVSKSNVTFVAEQVSHHPPSKLWQYLCQERGQLERGDSKINSWLKSGICTFSPDWKAEYF